MIFPNAAVTEACAVFGSPEEIEHSPLEADVKTASENVIVNTNEDVFA